MAGVSGALEILDRFLEEAPGRLESALRALSSGDLKTVQFNLHRIRSDAGWLGAREVQELAGQGEEQIVAGQAEGLQELLERLSGCCYDASQELERQRTVLLGSKEG